MAFLYFASDRNGWWNLERLTGDGEIEPVYESKSELGMPQWVFGMSSYAFASPSLIVCSHVEHGVSRLGTLNTETGEYKDIDCPFTDIQYVRAANGKAIFRGGSPIDVACNCQMDLEIGEVGDAATVERVGDGLQIFLSSSGRSSFRRKPA